MYCPRCKAAVDDDDSFCPKCGGGVILQTRGQSASAAVAGAMTVGVPSDAGARVLPTRVPIAEGGRKYPGLSRAADLSIKGASVVRILSAVLGALFAASVMLYGLSGGFEWWYLVVAALAGISVAAIGQLVALAMLVSGELMYVVIDVEEDIRRRA